MTLVRDQQLLIFSVFVIEDCRRGFQVLVNEYVIKGVYYNLPIIEIPIDTWRLFVYYWITRYLFFLAKDSYRVNCIGFLQ